jgi:hypothetical protein
LINSVTCTSTKLDLILSALKQAPAPWSLDVQALNKLGASLHHPNVALIREQEKLVVVKQMVVKYQAGKSYCRQGREAERLLQRIFKVSQSQEALQDGLKVADVMHGVNQRDARRFYIERLVIQDAHGEALKVLKHDVDNDDEAVEITERMLIKAEILDDDIKQLETLVHFLKAALVILMGKKTNTANYYCHLVTRIDKIKKKVTLEALYGIKDIEMIPTLLKQWMDDQTIDQMYGKMLKIADLTEEPLEDLLVHLFKVLIRNERVQDLERCLKIILLNQDEAYPKLIKVVQDHLDDEIVLNGSLISALAKITSQNVSNCSEETFLLTDLILVSSWFHYVGDLQDQSYDKHMFDNIEDNEDDLAEMNLFKGKLEGNHFKDKGLPLDPALVLQPIKQLLPLQKKFLSSTTTLLLQKKQQDQEINLDVTAPPGSPPVPVQVDQNEGNINETDIEAAIAKLSEFCSSLVDKNQTYLAFKAIKILEWPLIGHEKIAELIKGCHQTFLSLLLSKILSDKRPDLPFGLAFLTGQTKTKSGLKALGQVNTNIGLDNGKLANLSRLGSRYSSRLGLLGEKSQFISLLTNATWAKRFGLSGLELANISPGSPEHLDILADFIGKTAQDGTLYTNIISDLEQYAKAFGPFSISTVMELFVRKVLTAPSLHPVLIQDEQLRIDQNLLTSVTLQVDQALKLMQTEEKDNLLKSLAMSELSPYNYEVLEYVFNHFDVKDVKSEQILEFVNTYKRCHPPSEEETDEWLNSRTTPFPGQVAKLRLPFHSLMHAKNNPKDMFKLLSNEFVIESYEQWLNASKVFRIAGNNIRVLAAQNTVSKLMPNGSIRDHDHWCADPIMDKDVLKQVLECLEGITDLYKATSAAHWVGNRLPRGREKLIVARICLQFAANWHDEHNDEASAKGLSFAAQNALKLEVEDILQKYSLHDNSSYLELIHQVSGTLY